MVVGVTVRSGPEGQTQGMKQLRITLYGHSGCPGTKRARRFFRLRRLPVVERDVADPRVWSEWVAQGVWATPLVIIADIKMVGFDQERCQQILDRFPGEG